MSRRGQGLLLATLIATPLSASAYIDPGTGSALIQGLIATVAAVGVTAKLYWHRLMAFFGRKADSGAQKSTEPSSSEASQPAE